MTGTVVRLSVDAPARRQSGHPPVVSLASLDLLARAGLHGTVARATLLGAAGLDVASGLATLALRRRRRLYLPQSAPYATEPRR